MSLVVIIGALQQQGLLPEGLLEIPDDLSLFLEFPIDRSMKCITSDKELLVATDLFQQNKLRRMVFIVTPSGKVPAYPHISDDEDVDKGNSKADKEVLTQ